MSNGRTRHAGTPVDAAVQRDGGGTRLMRHAGMVVAATAVALVALSSATTLDAHALDADGASDSSAVVTRSDGGGDNGIVTTIAEILKLKYEEALLEAAEDQAEAERAAMTGDPEASEEADDARESALEAEEARRLLELYGNDATPVVLDADDDVSDVEDLNELVYGDDDDSGDDGREENSGNAQVPGYRDGWDDGNDSNDIDDDDDYADYDGDDADDADDDDADDAYEADDVDDDDYVESVAPTAPKNATNHGIAASHDRSDDDDDDDARHVARNSDRDDDDDDDDAD